MRFPVAFGRNCGTLDTMDVSRLTRPHVIAVLLATALIVPSTGWAAQTRHTHSGHATAQHGRSHRASLHRHRHHALLGQREMDPQRALEIQQALVEAHYLNGTPTGQWDPETQAAMQKYQADNGWQTKITPDSRALIKLGLGPKQDEGEYATAAAGVSKLSGPGSADTLSALATSEMPASTTQN